MFYLKRYSVNFDLNTKAVQKDVEIKDYQKTGKTSFEVSPSYAPEISFSVLSHHLLLFDKKVVQMLETL